MKIGLLGGSFNPVHNAHLRIAAAAQRACQLDKVIFIPAANPPHKTLAGDISFELRTSMVSLAISGISPFEASLVEGERDGKSYSIDTIRIFSRLHPGDELFFIIGGDSFLEIGTWQSFDEIFRSCNIIVVERPGSPITDPLEALPDAVKGEFRLDVSRDCLTHESGNSVFFITGTPIELSSSAIRRLVASGADISQYVPTKVAAYISQQRIYTNASKEK
jgi:nicotinate-nucleotide adenylyltransferase